MAEFSTQATCLPSGEIVTPKTFVTAKSARTVSSIAAFCCPTSAGTPRINRRGIMTIFFSGVVICCSPGSICDTLHELQCLKPFLHLGHKLYEARGACDVRMPAQVSLNQIIGLLNTRAGDDLAFFVPIA